MSRLPRTDFLIRAARTKSINKDFGAEYGLDDDFFLIAIRQAAIEIQSFLVGQMIELKASYNEYTCVPGQEAYDLPTTLFSDNLVYGIEYSDTGNAWDYTTLRKMSAREFGQAGIPERFFIDGASFYLDYAPSSSAAKLRIRFESRLYKGDLIRGLVSSATFPTIILSDTSLDATAFSILPEYVCISDRAGNSRVANLPILSWDSTNNTLTIDSSVPPTHFSDIVVGDRVTIGEDTTTHIELFPICENYIIEYAKNEAYESQSSEDQGVSNPKLEKLLQRIASVYEYNSGGKTPIPERRDD